MGARTGRPWTASRSTCAEKYAAGVEGFSEGFVHTVVVNMRARLRASADHDRIFRVSKEVAAAAGLIG